MVGWFTEICDMFIKFVGTGWFHWLIAAIILVAGSVKNTHFRPYDIPAKVWVESYAEIYDEIINGGDR